MTLEETKAYITAILNSFNLMLKNNDLHINSIEGTQQFSGCIQALINIRDNLNDISNKTEVK